MKPRQAILTLILLSMLQLPIGCSTQPAPPSSSKADLSTPSSPQSVPFSVEHWKAFKNGGIKDYEGKIGNDIEIEIIVEGSENPVSDDSISLDGYGVYKKFNKPFPVRGHANIGRKDFEIYEFASHKLEETGTYKGNLTSNNKLEGTWVFANKEMPFSLVEKSVGDKRQLASRIAEAKGEFENIKKGAGVQKEEDASLDDQAINKIKEMFEKVYVRCGDSYYVFGPNCAQLKEVSFVARPKALSDVDKLNGVQWTGQVHIQIRFYREHIGRQWSDFSQGSTLHLNARNEKGRWELDTDFLFFHRADKKSTCNQIPPG